MKKSRLKEIISEELFYRDFYRASDLLAFREALEEVDTPTASAPPEDSPAPPTEEEKLSQQQKYVQRGVETVRLSPEDYKQMIFDVLMSPKVYDADRKAVFYEIFGTNYGPRILANIREMIKIKSEPGV